MKNGSTVAIIEVLTGPSTASPLSSDENAIAVDTDASRKMFIHTAIPVDKESSRANSAEITNATAAPTVSRKVASLAGTPF